MSTTRWNPAHHLVSPDGKWYWDGVAQEWKAVATPAAPAKAASTPNPAAAQLLGYGVDELTGLNVDALVPDSVRPRHASFREAYGRETYGLSLM